MIREKRKHIQHDQYRFRGSIFHIPGEELLTAIRQARRLQNQLMEALGEEIEHHAARLEIRRQLAPGRACAAEQRKCGPREEANHGKDEYVQRGVGIRH